MRLECKGTGWRPYDRNHTQVCEFCCKHDPGWWELTPSSAGYKKGENNLCCKAGCGTMKRDLGVDKYPYRDMRQDIPPEELSESICMRCDRERIVCKHGMCNSCQCEHYCWLD